MDFNRYCNEQSLKTPYNNFQKCTYEENQMNLIYLLIFNK